MEYYIIQSWNNKTELTNYENYGATNCFERILISSIRYAPKQAPRK